MSVPASPPDPRELVVSPPAVTWSVAPPAPPFAI